MPIDFVLYIVSAILAGLSAVGVPVGNLNLLAASFFFYVLTYLV